jgi:pSer/pThr/pTyr-binding forkhead associated (FHA) protein
MLKLRFKENKYNAVWLVEPKITIGRSATNALVVDDPHVVDVHLEILVDNETLTLKNLAPTRPVRVNDTEVIGDFTLRPEDVITLGAVDLIVVDPKREPKALAEESSNTTQLRASKPSPWSLKANHTALANRVFPLKELTVIGRASECDISLAAAHLSRRHAQIQVVEGGLLVKDLGSANGTFINGQRITEGRAKKGDEIRFDTLSFGVMGPSTEELSKTTVRSAPLVPPEMPVKPAKPLVKPVIHSSSSSSAYKPKPVNQNPTGSHKGLYSLLLVAAITIVLVALVLLNRQ